MINHARNLLLNTADVSYFPDIPFEEIVDPGYAVKTLPGYLTTVRNVLFGTSPDRLMLNIRSRQLLAALHSTELEEFILKLDKRITYTFDTALFKLSSGYSVKQTSGAVSDLGIVRYTDIVADKTGKCRYSWSVAYDGSDTTITSDKQASAIYTPIFTDNMSELLQLPGVADAIRHADAAATWRVVLNVLPEKTLGQLVADLDALGGDTLLRLFGIGSLRATTEPFTTLYNLWNSHYDIPHRLGAVVLALILKTNEL
jgi:hypothetical protein